MVRGAQLTTPDNFWTLNPTPENYKSMEREFNSE